MPSSTHKTERAGSRQDAEQRHLRRRYARDKRFRIYTMSAIAVAGAFLVVFLGDLLMRGLPALRQAEGYVTITYSAASFEDYNDAVDEGVMRDIISRTRLRKIPQECGRYQIVLTLTVDAGDDLDPSGAIESVTLEEDEFTFAGAVMRENAPYVISADILHKMIHETALAQIQEAVRDASVGETINVSVWVNDKTNSYLNYGDKTNSKVEEAIRLLSPARITYSEKRIDAHYDVLTYGEETSFQEWALLDSDFDQYLKGKDFMQPEAFVDSSEPKITPERAAELDQMRAEGTIRLAFNKGFFLNGDSKIPEAAGLRSAIVGSVYVLTIVFIICMPIGVLTAIYLEEFAPDNIITQTIEVNINNLAAIPSILFGVLGLAVLINFMHIPRSSALVGGMTLALMTLPVIIISARAALRAVPDSIRMAGFSMGATRWQVVLHHVLPLSTSGIMTGSIIGIAQAMGETAPLIIIGLVAFVPEAPTSPTAATTVMPAQIYSWAEMSLRGFEERTALAILVLLAVLFTLNGIAVLIRARSERKW